MTGEEPPQETPSPELIPDTPRILFVWQCEDIGFANRLATFFEGIDMIVRVNRSNISVELLGFNDGED
jgi:hypothetical protein